MPSFKMNGLDEYREQLKKLEYRSIGLCKYALYEGAKIVADEVKRRIPKDSGDLARSMGLSVMRKKDNYIYTEIYFDGYDQRGVPNALKANVLESGSSGKHGQKKKPFMRPAFNATKSQAEDAIRRAMDEKLAQYFNE